MSIKNKFDYDILVIGSGSAGLTAARMANGMGKHVAIVERAMRLGGTCTWTGCVPSKTLIHAANVCHNIRNSERFGLRLGEPIIQTDRVMEHVRSVMIDTYTTHDPVLLDSEGIDLINADVRFLDKHTLLRNNDDSPFRARNIVIAAGSSPHVPKIPGLDIIPYYTTDNFFSAIKLPKSIIIVGGGVVGVELGCALNRLGVVVTIIEQEMRLLPDQDEELVSILTEQMLAEGITIKTNTFVDSMAERSGMVKVKVLDDKRERNVIGAEKILMVTGRKPNVYQLHCENAGVDFTRNGVLVNTKMQTTSSNIYACGDIVGPYRFSHIAWAQAVTAVHNLCIPIFKKHMNKSDALWTIFAASELASSGLNELQARRDHEDVRVYRYPYSKLDRSRTDGVKYGLAKVICSGKGHILGVQILGPRAGDLIHELHLARLRGAKLRNLFDVVHAYPTYAEINWKLAHKAYVEYLQENKIVQFLKKFFITRR